MNIQTNKKKEASKDWWDNLSKEEKEGIEQGLKDAEEGRVYPHKQVMSEFKKRVGL